MSENYFVELNNINVSEKAEKKGKLTYLSWVWAWGEVKKRHPDATYTIYENDAGMIYHTDGKTCWVKTGVTINGIEHIEYLPVMDYKNDSIPLERVTSMDVNKAIQRSITKAIARHGLGLYIYAGEDVPESEAPEDKPAPAPAPTCADCGCLIYPIAKKDGDLMKVNEVAEYSKGKFGRCLCGDCMKKAQEKANIEKAERKAAEMEAQAEALAHEDAGDRL